MHKKNEIREAITLEISGLKVFGILHRPKECESGARVPAVVMLHGFGGNKSGRHRLITRLAELLAENGIAAFRIDYRGSGDSEGAFGDTTIKTLTEDALLAMNFLVNHPSIDPQKIGVYGRSMGGLIAVHASAAFLRQYPGSIQALVLWAPVYDAKPWLSQVAVGGKITHAITAAGDGKTFYFLGEELHPEFIKQFSEYKAEECLQALKHTPLFIIQGEKDQTVDSYHLEQYKNNSDRGAITEILLLSNTDHEFTDRDEQIIALQETKSHFIEQLKPKSGTVANNQIEVMKSR